MAIFLSFDVQGQYNLSTEWAKQIGSSQQETARIVKSSESGEYFAVGTFKDFTDLETDPELEYIVEDGIVWTEASMSFLAKYSENGDLIWGKAFVYMTISDFAITNDNEIVLTGRYGNSDIDADPGEGEHILEGSVGGVSSCAVIKLDENGDFVWAANGGSMHLDAGITATCVQTDNEGNVYFGGEINRYTQFKSSNGAEFTLELHHRHSNGRYLMKLNSSGEFIWWELIDGYDLSLVKIIVDNPNRILLAGTASGGFWVDPFGTDEFISLSGIPAAPYLLAYSLDGDFLAAKVFREFYRFKDIEMDDSKNIYLAASYEGYIDADPGPGVDNMYALSGEEGAIIKLNNNWEYLWGNAYASVEHIELDVAQDVVALGSRFIDPLLTDEFFALYGITSHGLDTFIDSLQTLTYMGLALSDDNSIITTGYFYGELEFETEEGATVLVSEGSSDIILIKKRYDGLLEIENDITALLDIQVYPNPTKDILTIESEARFKLVNVYDLYGNSLISESSNVLSLEHLSSGVYLMVVETDEGLYKSRVVKR